MSTRLVGHGLTAWIWAHQPQCDPTTSYPCSMRAPTVWDLNRNIGPRRVVSHQQCTPTPNLHSSLPSSASLSLSLHWDNGIKGEKRGEGGGISRLYVITMLYCVEASTVLVTSISDEHVAQPTVVIDSFCSPVERKDGRGRIGRSGCQWHVGYNLFV